MKTFAVTVINAALAGVQIGAKTKSEAIEKVKGLMRGGAHLHFDVPINNLEDTFFTAKMISCENPTMDGNERLSRRSDYASGYLKPLDFPHIPHNLIQRYVHLIRSRDFPDEYAVALLEGIVLANSYHSKNTTNKEGERYENLW